MAEINPESIVASLEGAFGDGPAVKTPAPAPAPKAQLPKAAPAPEKLPQVAEEAEPEPETEEIEVKAVEGDEPEAEGDEQEAAPPEPEFEIEVDGQKEVIRGTAQVKELLQKGMDYSRKAEVNARNADVIAIQARNLQMEQQLNAAIFGDVVEFQAIEAQLKPYDNIDWAKAYDESPFEAMKAKEVRDQLRERRNAKIAAINERRQAIQQGQAQAAQQTLEAETKALLAKLPQWRNSEQAMKEKTALVSYLMDSGYSETEVNAYTDHRGLILARKAWLYDQLQAGKAEKVKQVREAPGMAKPGAAGAQKAPNDKATFAKFQQELRAQGRKGNHYAQEQLMLKTLNRVFK